MLPYSGLAFTINEQAKRQIAHVAGREPTMFEGLMCGAMSGLFAQILSYPHEVTRRRMQTIGIVPTTGSETAAVMVTQLKPPSLPEGIPEGALAEGTERLQQQHSQEQSRAQQRPQSQHAQSSQQRQHKRPEPLSMITTIKRLFGGAGHKWLLKGRDNELGWAR